MRTRPRRETRGVSRSKCGDLITACVPVSWATSIIVNESTDAVDLFDGFGTTELVIGIRAYQWGWEYYYPKDLDLNYNIKKNYSAFIGNSVKYNYASSTNLKTNKFFKFYQNKQFDFSNIPAQLLFSSFDNAKILNFLNFNEIGASALQESNIFKKNSLFFKTNKNFLYSFYSKFDSVYVKLNKNFFNENTYLHSFSYHLKKQQTFFTKTNFFTDSNFFINKKSFSKILNFNWNLKSQNSVSEINQSNTSKFINNNFFHFQNNFFEKYLNNIFFKNNFKFSLVFSNLFDINKKKIYLINDNNDNTKLKTPFLKFFNNKFFKNVNFNGFNTENIFLNNENNNFLNVEKNNFFKNTKIRNLFSSNESVLFNQRYIRKFLKSPKHTISTNLTHTHNSSLNLLNYYKTNNIVNNMKNFYFEKNKFFDIYTFNKLLTNKVYFSHPHPPIVSSVPNLNQLNYDVSKLSKIKNLPLMFQGRDDFVPAYLKTSYWNFFFTNFDITTRLLNNIKFLSRTTFFYFPNFSQFYDYNFKNNQNLNLLENSFWDSSYFSSSYEEYIDLSNNFFNEFFSDKNYVFFNAKNRHFRYLEKLMYSHFINENENFDFSYSNFFANENNLYNLNLIIRGNTGSISILNFLSDIDETYDYFKYLNLFSETSYFLNLNNFWFNFHSYWLITNSFRSNYDPFFFSNENNSFFKNIFFFKDFFKNSDWDFLDHDNFPLLPITYKNYEENIFLNVFFLYNETFNIDNMENLINFNQKTKNNTLLNIRNTTKNLIINYNSLQKVFRARLDENRSFASLNNLSDNVISQSNLTSPKPSFETLIGKNKTNFFKTNFYSNFNNFANFLNYNNFYIFKFPFLLSYKSDAAKYVWLDWFSRWHFCEVQPSSSSKYAIHGMPYLNKPFEYTSIRNDLMNESESYIIRLMRARKNYLPNYIYNPFLNKKNNIWYKINFFSEKFNSKSSDLAIFKKNLNLIKNIWNFNFFSIQNNLFIPSISNMNSYTKSLWRPSTSVSTYYYNISALFDILTKREYIYRQFFLNSDNVLNLSNFFSNNPNNRLTRELKPILLNTNDLLFKNEFSKNITVLVLEPILSRIVKSIIFSNNFSLKMANWVETYFYDTSTENFNKTPLNLYKNQYRPLKKGVNNMLRLHATGAIAMPIEIRLQILASSKDVIHSWAVPSAGIKIDCVPGYSSHKVMIFLISGIFWGQCMEICGRYHHWMPIVVYFMKRDLFFLWCTHFVFLSSTDNNLNMNDKQFINLTKTVSVDKNTWISELFY